MTITRHIPLLFMTFLGLPGLLNAQTYTALKTQVPFAFVVNGKTMPAGECTVAVDVRGRTFLTISSGEQHAYALPIAVELPNARKKSALVFHQYGDRYFLTGIKRESEVYRLPVSEPERELQARYVPWQVLTLLASAK